MQVPLSQSGVLHSVATPQSPGSTHWTHCPALQTPPLQGVPFGASATPHTPPVQLGDAHSFASPQSVGSRQSTQCPLPSHLLPLLQLVPACAYWKLQSPALQM